MSRVGEDCTCTDECTCLPVPRRSREEVFETLLKARDSSEGEIKDAFEEILSIVSPIGKKDDNGKDRWDRIEWDVISELAEVLTFGAAKHSENEDGWKSLPDARRRYFAATLRHLMSWWLGENDDGDSGLPHLAHVLCNVMFLRARDKIQENEEP